ncbi:putative transport protein [Yersinia massiliensis]|uniref:MFS transporter n=1 Tax=Yersinia massiliensis TaxID=419257 RepID=UPI0005E8077E|nr:MFS transporter [Yersinia massiliensis]CNI55186.1 putative transport protein [Yersinia massiliensis]
MITNDASRWSDLFSGKNAAFAIALSGGVVLHAINIYIATTILPSVVLEIDGLSLYAWNTTLFVTASILGSALSARLLSGYGPRSAYLFASLVFMLGSALCAMAPNMPLMLIGRTVQGLGGGFLFALSYAMINLVFAQSLWPRAMALISGMWGVATLIGPAIGGIFAQMDAWRFAFWTLLPVTLIYAIFTWRILPAGKSSTTASALPVTQLVLLTAIVLTISASSIASSSVVNMAGMVLAILLLLLLFRIESRATARLLPKGALRLNSPLAALYITISLLAVGITCEIFVPYFLQTLHGQSPLISGYIAATMAAGWTISEMMSAGWKKSGIRWAIISGPLIVLAGIVGLAVLMPATSMGGWQQMAPIALALTMVGFGIGFGWPHLLTRILQVAADEDKDIAGASITTVQMFATAVGAAMAGMVANLSGLNLPGGVVGAQNTAHWLFTLFAIAPALAMITALRCAAIRSQSHAAKNAVSHEA